VSEIDQSVTHPGGAGPGQVMVADVDGGDAEGGIPALVRTRAEMTAAGKLFAVEEEVVRGNRMPAFTHRYRSLRQMLEATDRFGERTFVVDRQQRLSFVEHREVSDALAVTLQSDFGVRPGDSVALFAANRWEWIVAFWAITSIGAIPAAFNGWWTPDETAHAIALVEPVLLIGDGPRLERVSHEDRSTPTLDLDDMTKSVGEHAGEHPRVPTVAEDDVAMLLFTSGTTGRAKAVMVTHRSVIGFVQLSAFGEALATRATGGPIPIVGDVLPASDQVVLVTSPLFHTSMLEGMVMSAAYRGSSVVLLPGRFDPRRVLETIERERVTMWSALGSAATRVCGSDARGRYDTSSMRRLGVGGAPVSPYVQKKMRETFPSASQSLGMGYTSTEGGAVVANIGGPEYVAHPTSTGRVTLTTALEIRDPDGHPVPPGAEGEIHVRSPYIMLGYWNDPQASAAVLKDGGWLAMGDIGRLESDLLYINSRARDLILVSAENVSPTEVEYCLEEHPRIAEAAVFAVDDADTGDAVCAVVSLSNRADVSAHELDSWCRDRLAHFKVPKCWYVLRDALPRTATGKLLKSELRSRVESGLLRPNEL
jgi:long-chain acyl-CoA synthetase